MLTAPSGWRRVLPRKKWRGCRPGPYSPPARRRVVFRRPKRDSRSSRQAPEWGLIRRTASDSKYSPSESGYTLVLLINTVCWARFARSAASWNASMPADGGQATSRTSSLGQDEWGAVWDGHWMAVPPACRMASNVLGERPVPQHALPRPVTVRQTAWPSHPRPRMPQK